MASNFLNYTGLSYDDIKTQVVSRLSQDSRFANYQESQLYAIINEIFAANTDFVNYYIQRRAEESYPGTAKLRSSIIELSKILGYVIRRPVPSTTSIKITLKNLPLNATAGQIIQFPQFSQFQFSGKSYVLSKTLTYVLTQDDINNFTNPTYFKVFEYYSKQQGLEGRLFDSALIPDQYKTPITLFQGEFKTLTIDNSITQSDQRFQTYKINDKTFSNWFGDEDFGFDVKTSNIDVTLNLTRIAIGTDPNTAFCSSMSEISLKKEFYIDRRSFLNDITIPQLTASDSGKSVKFCVLKTNLDDTIQLNFADDVISSIGATGDNNIYVRYLSTDGASGNFTGVIGKTIDIQTNNFGNNFSSKNFVFELRRNITGGSDIEDVESIKINSPEIFYSLDRCVTPRDYVNFLRTLTINGNDIKNAIVWGEQEETRDSIYKIPNIKLFNVVLFSVLTDLYAKQDGAYVGLQTDDNIYLDNNNSNDWYNLMVLSDSNKPLQTVQTLDSLTSNLKQVYDKLYSRSEITTKNVYITPIVHDFTIGGTIYLNSLVDKNKVYPKITDAIYSYLSQNADFNKPIYLSNLIETIENFYEVNHADIYFIPKNLTDSNYLYVSDTAADIPSIANEFPSKPIGYVFHSSVTGDNCGTRQYSTSNVDNSFTFYQKTITPLLTAYSPNTVNAICCLLPTLEMKMEKYDETTVRTTPIWPSLNIFNNTICSITTVDNNNTDTNYVPSERNLYLGMMSCFYNNLLQIVNRDPALSIKNNNTLTQQLNLFLSQRDNCFCSLRKLQSLNGNIAQTQDCIKYINAAIPSEVNNFISNDILTVINLFRNSLVTDISNGLMDSYGNIVNFSMRNEIARVQAPDISQYIFV